MKKIKIRRMLRDLIGPIRPMLHDVIGRMFIDLRSKDTGTYNLGVSFLLSACDGDSPLAFIDKQNKQNLGQINRGQLGRGSGKQWKYDQG